MLLINTTIFDFVVIVITSTVGMFGVSMGLEGYFSGHIHWSLRILCIAGGLLLIYPGLVTDVLGIVIVGGIVLLQVLRNRRKAAAAP